MVDAADGCFSAAGPEKVVKVKGNMKATKDRTNLQEKWLQ